ECVLGCNGDDGRCPDGDVCVMEDAWVCREACTASSDCGNGQICANGICAVGCLSNDDCGFLAPICDTSGGSPGECVGCLQDSDCIGGRLCHEPARTCAVRCLSVGSGDGCLGQVCLDDEICVQCIEDDDCGSGETCDTTTNTCVSPPASLCEPCQSDDDCVG